MCAYTNTPGEAPTRLADTRSPLEDKQPSDRPNRQEGWCYNQRILHRLDSDSTKLHGSTKWVPGIIRTQLGPLSYEVEGKPGLVWCQHTEQLRDTRIPVTPISNPVTQTSELPIQVKSREDPVSQTSEQPAASNMETDVPPPSPVADLAASSPPNLSEPVPEPVPVRRYPVRVRRPPARLDL